VDAIEGENVLVITDLAPGADGKVEFRGTSWSAKNVGNNPLIKGEQGVVEKIKGVTLLIRSQ
jgi:membrane protein implicated in regulation of membrane protease activity